MSEDVKLRKLQCCHCGSISYTDKMRLRDEVYMDKWCEKCGCLRLHLDVGENLIEYYEMYDINLDIRYFEYNTK